MMRVTSNFYTTPALAEKYAYQALCLSAASKVSVYDGETEDILAFVAQLYNMSTPGSSLRLIRQNYDGNPIVWELTGH